MIDADLLDNGTRHPNLAQLKMSAYCKSRGHNVRLLFRNEDLKHLDQFDALIISKVFNFTRLPSQLQRMLPSDVNGLALLNTSIKDGIISLENEKCDAPVIMIGGTGFFETDGGRNLDYEIEHMMPDYSLYDEYVEFMVASGRDRNYFDDYLNYSIGFTTRGCFRKCSFCVNRKYDKAVKHSPVNEFLDSSRPMIYLWDDNVFACFNDWETIFDDLIATNKPFQFRQGLDIRLLTDKHAYKLANCKYHGDFIFAFDHPEDREIVQEKLTLWRKYVKKTTKLYVLCAFDAQDKWDKKTDITPLELNDIEGMFERIHLLMTFGCLPYIMRYQFYKQSQFCELYVQVARWCNQPRFFKKMSFREFCVANQKYHKDSETKCSSYRTLINFEGKYPDMASKYFDLKYEKENVYKSIPSYGRKDTCPCAICKETKVTWDEIVDGTANSKQSVTAFMQGVLDPICFSKELHVECMSDPDDAIDILTKQLLATPLTDIVRMIDELKPEYDISTVPQFSSFDEAVGPMLKCINERECATYTELGSVIDTGIAKTEVAKKKYGENHAKLATLMGLTYIGTKFQASNTKIVSIAPMGKKMLSLSTDEKNKLIYRLILRIPFIQHLIQISRDKQVSLTDVLADIIQSKSTIGRRKTSIFALLDILVESGDSVLCERISNIC